MMEFTFEFPTSLVFGNGKLDQLGKFAATLGEKCLIVVGTSSAQKHGYLDRAIKSLKQASLSYSVFEGVSPNPKHTESDEAAHIARVKRADLVIALGGGSVMDAAKLACAVAASGGKTWEYMTGQRRITKGLPIIAVPTVAASGSEVATGAVISNPDVQEKRWVGSRHITPAIAIWDPETTKTLPAKPTAEGAVDILSHVLERFFNGIGNSPLGDEWAVGLMKQTVINSRIAVREAENINARQTLAIASSMAITQLTDLGRRGSFTCHAFEHVLSGFHEEIAHGSGLAALMEAWLNWMARTYPGRYQKLSDMWGSDFSESVLLWIRELGLATNLRELGVQEEELEQFDAKLWQIYQDRLTDMKPKDTQFIWRKSLGT